MSSTHVFSCLRHNHLPAFRWRISLGGHPARPWFPLHVPCLFQACPSASCSWTLALPSVLPPTMFIYLHTLLWQPQVLSWRCGRPLRPSKSTPVLPSVWLWTAGICWRLLLGTVICWAKRVPREPPSSCVYVWGCVQRCAVVYVCLWHEFREAAAGLGPSQGLCSGAVRKQACCETPTLPWRSGRNAILQQGLDTGSTCCPSPRGTGRISGGGRQWWSPSAAARP